MKGPIERITRERIDQRGASRLDTAWVDTGTSAAPPTGLTALLSGQFPRLHAPAESPVLIMLSAEPQAAHEALLEAISSKARVHVLVGSNWSKEPIDPRIHEARNVLLRSVQEVPASAVWTGMGSYVSLGERWAMRLDDAQGRCLRQVFLRLFWHEAAEEAWSAGGRLAWRSAAERPFDVPRLAPDAAVNLLDADARLGCRPEDQLTHLTEGQPPSSARRLHLPAGPQHHPALARLLREGASVFWQDHGLPDLRIFPDGGEALLRGSRGRLRISLTAQQALELTRLLRTPARWAFQTDLTIGSPSVRYASFWLPEENSPRRLEERQCLDVDEVVAPSIREMERTDPATFPVPQPLALSVQFRWRVVPPRVPSGAEEDRLVSEWKKLDTSWSARVQVVREQLEQTERETGRIGGALLRLASALLGFGRARERLRQQLDELDRACPSAKGPTEAPTMLAKLADIEAGAKGLARDLEQAEQKAREDEAREKQQAEWRARVTAAEHELTEKRTSLERLAQELSAVEQKLSEVESDLSAAEGTTREDLLVRQKRLRDERTATTKGRDRLAADVKDLDRRTKETFEFRPPAAPASRPTAAGGRFVPPASSGQATQTVPSEALPEVGALRSKKGERFLVIDRWEDLELGERAASRLKARLVAPETV